MQKLLIILVSIAILILPSFAGAQITFERWYGGSDQDWGYSVSQTTDGGYIIVGKTWSYGAGWYDVYGGTLEDVGHSVAQTTDGGYIIAGWTESYGADDSSDVYLIKTDSIGDTSWTRTYGGAYNDQGNSVAQTTDEGYIIAGWTQSYGAGYYDVYLIKTDSIGDTSWTRTYGGTDDDHGNSVAQTTDGGYIIAGTTKSYGVALHDFDAYLIKTDSVGDTLWTKTYGDTFEDRGYSVTQTTDAGYIIAGMGGYVQPGHYDVWSWGTSVAQTTDGSYIITGAVVSGLWYYDVYLMKTDSIGDTLWTRAYGDTASDQAYSVAQTSDGGYIMVGSTSSYSAGMPDVYLIKTDAMGNVGIKEEPDLRHKTKDAKLLASPNPFSSEVRIQLTEDRKKSDICPLSSDLCLTIYDISGRLVKSFSVPRSQFSIPRYSWNGRDDAGKVVSPGVYFLKLNDKPVGKVVKVR
jgi:hypothetical protein